MREVERYEGEGGKDTSGRGREIGGGGMEGRKDTSE